MDPHSQAPEIDMAKPKQKGTNFSRSFGPARPIRARDKRVIQRVLKRQKKLTMEIN